MTYDTRQEYIRCLILYYYRTRNVFILSNHETNLVVPRSVDAQSPTRKGKVYVSASCTRTSRNIRCLTLRASAIFTERDNRVVGPAKEARVDA